MSPPAPTPLVEHFRRRGRHFPHWNPPENPEQFRQRILRQLKNGKRR